MKGIDYDSPTNYSFTEAVIGFIHVGKYAPLHDFLAAQGCDRIPMSFEQIETLLGVKLPPSKRYPAWWSNNPSNNPMTREWLAAGFETESVNTAAGTLTFRRVPEEKVVLLKETEVEGELVTPPVGFHPIFGCMRGLGHAAEGVNLAGPADPELGDYLDRKLGRGIR